MSIPLPGWSNFLDRQLVPIQYRKRPRRNPRYESKKSKLSVSQWLELIFQYNELRAMQYYLNSEVKPFTNEQILHNFKLEFGGKHKVKKGDAQVAPGNSILSGIHTMNFKRNEYRRGELFSGQIRPFLIPLRYFDDGKVIKDATKKRPKYPTFQECQQLCIDFKIADPRFFTIDEMERLHQFAIKEGIVAQWRFPTSQELKNLGEILPIDPYRSILTYDLHKKENPHQAKTKAVTPDTVEAERVQIEANEKEKLEQQRRATKKLVESFDPSELERPPEGFYE